MSIQIRPLTKNDFEQWKPLFEGYCDFYEHPADKEKLDTEWRWLQDPNNMLQGLVASNAAGKLVGIAHYHAWPNSVFGCELCYLSDLYVDPAERGTGIGKQLYDHLLDLCRENGWSALTLLTQETNTVARSLYDQYAEATDFRFYVTPVDAAS